MFYLKKKKSRNNSIQLEFGRKKKIKKENNGEESKFGY